MADFNHFFPTLLRHEGGFVNDPADPGGATNKGVTLGTFRLYAKSLLGVEPTLDNLRALTDEQAGKIYKKQYWDAIGGDAIRNQSLADIVFDFQVNAGNRSARLLQTVLNQLGAAPPLVVDGVVGKGTIVAVNTARSADVFNRFKQGRKDYYTQLAAQKPSLAKFLKGWLNRVESFTYAPDPQEA
ncbi:glycosyl hydrolase 108 family protein [Luteibacter sp. PPL201]|uniref:Glycosyl hydrolase 108 family protein n=1 Tax=Luteibacter sahnii TaxID=3021977 RepID=A0ABT6B5M5_9GAMM